jgi:hypothetical protein
MSVVPGDEHRFACPLGHRRRDPIVERVQSFPERGRVRRVDVGVPVVDVGQSATDGPDRLVYSERVHPEVRVRAVAVIRLMLPVPAVSLLVAVLAVIVARSGGQQVDIGARVDRGHVRPVRREIVDDVVHSRLEPRHAVYEQVRIVNPLPNPRPRFPPVTVLPDRHEQFGGRGVAGHLCGEVVEDEKRRPRDHLVRRSVARRAGIAPETTREPAGTDRPCCRQQPPSCQTHLGY